jgi:hypothetical protein
MAIAFVYVVRAPDGTDDTQTLFSKKLLYPYAAWTGIACWLNVQTLLTDKNLFTTDSVNVISNLLLFGCIAAFTFYYFRKTSYSIFYGGVMVWAGVGVVAANLSRDIWLFTALGGLFAALLITLFVYDKFIAHST